MRTWSENTHPAPLPPPSPPNIAAKTENVLAVISSSLEKGSLLAQLQNPVYQKPRTSPAASFVESQSFLQKWGEGGEGVDKFLSLSKIKFSFKRRK